MEHASCDIPYNAKASYFISTINDVKSGEMSPLLCNAKQNIKNLTMLTAFVTSNYEAELWHGSEKTESSSLTKGRPLR